MAKKKFEVVPEEVIDSPEANVPETKTFVIEHTKNVEEPRVLVIENADSPEANVPETKKKLTKKDTHKVYSFWANKEQIEVWKCYQEANSDLEKAEDLGLKAIQEYIENHALSGTDAEMYELKLKSKGLENSSYR